MNVSVVIPNYNHSKYLRQRIDSILNQTYKDFEIIILDDCSTDTSRDIINEYIKVKPDIVFFQNDSNSGSPFIQWNFGVSKAKGEFIWIAESDDFADPCFLEISLSAMQHSENTGMVFCDSKIFNEQRGTEYLSSERYAAPENLKKNFSGENKNKISIRSFLENPIVNVSSVLFRKSSFLKAGGADPLMKYCGDWLLYLKIFLISGIEYIQEPLNVFRLHSGSAYHNHFRDSIFMREKIKIYFFIFRETGFSFLMAYSIIIKIIKILILRLVYLLGINSVLMIDLPRQPKQHICYD